MYSKIKLDDYLYQITYTNLDYQKAYDYFRNNGSALGACSSFRAGNYFGRNYDWLYDNSVEFVVVTKNTIGIAGNISELTKSFVESGLPSPLYDIVPFYLLDGINKNGLVVSMNVVPTDYGNNISIPEIRKRTIIANMMIPRYLLDHFSNAIDAVNYLKNYTSIYNVNKLKNLGYELHFIIADRNNTFVVELINNKLNILRQKVITNFHVSNVIFNKNGKVYTPSTQTELNNAIITNNITPNGCGLERYNLIKDLKSFSKRDIKQLLYDLRYSNTYRNLNWFTEFVGNGLTVNSSVKDYVKKIAPILDDLEYKSRDDSKLWQTVHSSLYDFNNLSLELNVQENFDKTFKFSL